MGTSLNRARVLLLLAALLTGVAGQWSSAVALSVSAGSFTTPGAVSSSGLRLWVDSSEQGSLGLNPRVRFWFDKSGESRHLSNVPSGVVPHATAVALRQQVVFEDGALAIGQPIPLNSLTAFYVIRGGSDTGYHPLLGKTDRATGLVVDAKRLRAANGGGSVISAVFGSISGSVVLMIRINSGATDYVSVNGGTEYSFSYSSSESATHIGAIYSSTGPRLLRASISEVLIWDRALTAAERTSVLRALGAKWGITVP
jgi:hypothetical protein